MRKANIFLKIGVHLSLWVLLFFINLLFLKNYSVRFDYIIHITTWLVYAIVFYATFYLLMIFFFKKNWAVFIGLSLIMLVSTFVVREFALKNYHDYVVSKNVTFRGRPPLFNDHPPRFGRGRRAFQRGRVMNNSYGLLIFYLLGFSLRLIQKWQDDEKQKVKLEKEKVSTELSFLKQQINPHFLFNSLNSIYSLSISKSESAPDSILKLSSILRYVLYESERELVFLRDELNTIRDYIELQQLRLTDKVRVNFKIEGIPENYKIEPLLIIPIIENAFKYGVDNVKDSFIDIHIKMELERFEIKVVNKIVSKPNKDKTDSGIGIKNIKRRLDLLHTNDYELDIVEENDVFSVRLKLKMKL